MKRFICVALAFVVLLSVSLPVFASDGSSGGFWGNIFSGIHDVGDFLRGLVVPPKNYFHDRLSYLNDLVNAKFSGLGQLYQTLNDFFGKLSNPPTKNIFVQIPSNFLFQGYSGVRFDLLTSARPYISFMRLSLTASFVLLTVIACYHKLRNFFTEQE